MTDFLTKAIEGGGASGPLRRELKRLRAELAACKKKIARLVGKLMKGEIG